MACAQLIMGETFPVASGLSGLMVPRGTSSWETSGTADDDEQQARAGGSDHGHDGVCTPATPSPFLAPPPLAWRAE